MEDDKKRGPESNGDDDDSSAKSKRSSSPKPTPKRQQLKIVTHGATPPFTKNLSSADQFLVPITSLKWCYGADIDLEASKPSLSNTVLTPTFVRFDNTPSFYFEHEMTINGLNSQIANRSLLALSELGRRKRVYTVREQQYATLDIAHQFL